MEDLTGQSTVTAIDPDEWNLGLYTELKNFITLWQTMVRADTTQFNKGINNAASTFNFYSCSGGPNAYLLAVIGSKPPPSQLINGMEIRFRPNAANLGGGTTVNLAGLGVRTVFREDGATPLQANDFVTTRDVHLRFNGSAFLLHVPYMGSNPMTVLPKQYREGLTMGRNPADTNQNQDVRVRPGSCRSQANNHDIVIGSNLDKRWDAAFGTGTSAGGYPSSLGARVADTWYRFFVIANTVSGEVDAGWDSIANTAATALIDAANTAHGTGGVGQWVYRQIGWTRTTSVTTEFHVFTNDPNDPSLFMYAGGAEHEFDVSNLALATGDNNDVRALPLAPPDTIALVHVILENKGSGVNPTVRGWLTDTDEPSAVAAGNTSMNFYAECTEGDRRHPIGPIPVRVDSSQQVVFKTNTSVSGVELDALVIGFHFRTS